MNHNDDDIADEDEGDDCRAPWREKAHRLIANLCREEYRKANPHARSRPHCHHTPYRVPSLASGLVDCLNEDDELRAKSLFHSYDGIKAIDAGKEMV